MEEFEHCCDDKSEKYKLGNIIRGLHGAFGKKFMACGMAAVFPWEHTDRAR